MARVRITLDRAGISEILHSQAMARLITGTAARVSAAIPGDTVVEPYSTDRRAAAIVDRRDSNTVNRQAKYGDLTAAAGSQGLRVRRR